MNSVNISGRLCGDPELRFIAGSGMAVCNFTLAVDKNISASKKKELEQQGKPTADFPRVVVWGKQAESCANFLKKGRRCIVMGSLQTSTYDDGNGGKRYSVDVLANRVEFLDFDDKKAPKKQESNNRDFYGDFTVEEDDSADIPF